MKKPLLDRIIERLLLEKESGCWIWTGPKTRDGYGRLWAKGKTRRAHRVTYELLIGEVPDGMQLDHLCRVRCCINPAHLEAVTCRENLIRGVGFASTFSKKTHCVHGHEFSVKNTRVEKRGTRHCRQCDKERHAKRKSSGQI